MVIGINGVEIGFTKDQVIRTLGTPELQCRVADDNRFSLSFRQSDDADCLLVLLDANNTVCEVKRGTRLHIDGMIFQLGSPMGSVLSVLGSPQSAGFDEIVGLYYWEYQNGSSMLELMSANSSQLNFISLTRNAQAPSSR